MGYAVLDTDSGRVERRPLPSEHGLDVDPFGSLGWVDETTLLVGYSELTESEGTDSSSARAGRIMPPLLWEAGRGARQAPASSGSVDLTAGGHGWLLERDDDHWQWILRNVRTAASRSMRQLNLSYDGAIAVSPGGQRLAGTASDLDGVLQLVDARGDVTKDTDDLTLAAHYWLDERRLVGTRRVDPNDARDRELSVLDLDSHRWTALVRGVPADDQADDHGQRYAFELLDRPTRPGPAPPDPWGERALAGSITGILVLGGLVLLVWRRRVRP